MIDVSLTFIAKNPHLRGSREFEGTVRLYHLRHSKNSAQVDGIAVKHPKHLIGNRVQDEKIEVLRLLQERVDIVWQLGESE